MAGRGCVKRISTKLIRLRLELAEFRWTNGIVPRDVLKRGRLRHATQHYWIELVGWLALKVESAKDLDFVRETTSLVFDFRSR